MHSVSVVQRVESTGPEINAGKTAAVSTDKTSPKLLPKLDSLSLAQLCGRPIVCQMTVLGSDARVAVSRPEVTMKHAAMLEKGNKT